MSRHRAVTSRRTVRILRPQQHPAVKRQRKPGDGIRRVRGSRGGAESPRALIAPPRLRGRGDVDALELSSCRGHKSRDQYPQSVSFTFERHRHIILTYEDFIDLHLTGAGRTDTPRVAPLYTWLTCLLHARRPHAPSSPYGGRHFSFATPRDHARSSFACAHMDLSFISFL
jgi:hypothetical protein